VVCRVDDFDPSSWHGIAVQPPSGMRWYELHEDDAERSSDLRWSEFAASAGTVRTVSAATAPPRIAPAVRMVRFSCSSASYLTKKYGDRLPSRIFREFCLKFGKRRFVNDVHKA